MKVPNQSGVICPFCGNSVKLGKNTFKTEEDYSNYRSIFICCPKCGENFIKIIPNQKRR